MLNTLRSKHAPHRFVIHFQTLSISNLLTCRILLIVDAEACAMQLGMGRQTCGMAQSKMFGAECVSLMASNSLSWQKVPMNSKPRSWNVIYPSPRSMMWMIAVRESFRSMNTLPARTQPSWPAATFVCGQTDQLPTLVGIILSMQCHTPYFNNNYKTNKLVHKNSTNVEQKRRDKSLIKIRVQQRDHKNTWLSNKALRVCQPMLSVSTIGRDVLDWREYYGLIQRTAEFQKEMLECKANQFTWQSFHEIRHRLYCFFSKFKKASPPESFAAQKAWIPGSTIPSIYHFLTKTWPY